jgi:hypothetical protein
MMMMVVVVVVVIMIVLNFDTRCSLVSKLMPIIITGAH